MPFWPDNIETWFCYAEADFYGHGVNDKRAKFLTVLKALPRKFDRHIARNERGYRPINLRWLPIQTTFLSKLPQQVQAVLLSFQNNALEELATSADCILEITKSNAEVFPPKEKPQTTQNNITELCHTLTRYLTFRNNRNRPHIPRRSTSRRRFVSRPRETDNPDWCWYHNEYGKSSRNCRKPYNFPNSKSTDTKNNLGNFQAGTHQR
ncbi:unnamed protein product [Schistosoma margrebowiei]|uniref:Uncharacterized protein n=1 Tax=Schistosoma margrebowiei TaxID=48269 RepID=A0A183N703_9TREM|nr:unnamed protein product [Schistosoma margrebowiei]